METKEEEREGKRKDDDEKVSWQCWMRTLFFCSGAMLTFVINGVTEGQSAVLLPQLSNKESIIYATPEERTWIASLGILMSPVSSLVIGPVTDLVGRKKGLLGFYISMGVGFGIIACASQVWHIYVGRLMCSFAMGLTGAAIVYVAESSTKTQRSILLASVAASANIGVSLAYIVGRYLPWNIASAIFSLICLLVFILQCLAPETPAWLYKSGQKDASALSLKKLGRSPAGIHREHELLQLSLNEQSEKFELKLLLAPTVWKPFVILSVFQVLQCLTGVFDVIFYTVDFIEQLGTAYAPLDVAIVISFIRIAVSSTLGVFYVGYVSRRFATVSSAFLMTASFVGAGAYTYIYRDTPVAEKPWQWLPIGLVIINVVSSMLGVTILPWLMPGEMFPLRVRGLMNGVVCAVGTGVVFIFIKMYAVSLQALHIWGLLFSFSVASFVTIFFGLFVLPETRNKTLYEIEQMFVSKKKMPDMTIIRESGEEVSKHSEDEGSNE